jgi:hypothetical protein
MRLFHWFVVLVSLVVLQPISGLAAMNPTPPAGPVKLIFIHHSCGENWLCDSNGGLGIALRDNNYFVSDTNYGWGPDAIGDTTDIGQWWTWFCGPNRDTYLAALYTENRQHSYYSRLADDPGGQNEIIMFKSCYPNSYLGGAPNDPPVAGGNPLRGEDCYSPYHKVGNAKGIYNDLLTYFATRQDKLFIVITAPPQAENETDEIHAANARALNDWLVREWLNTYPYNNVAVFDFYNVLTSNGGDPYTNDLGAENGNHHRFRGGRLEHQETAANNLSSYPSDPWDSHPTAAGNLKATGEFPKLLNIYYHCWKGTGACPCGVFPDIRANGSNGPLVVDETTPVSISVGLEAGKQVGLPADWWVAGWAPFGWYGYVYPTFWLPGIQLSVQIGLFDLRPAVEILQTPLPQGDYVFYMAVDDNADGRLDATWLDWVYVTVE